MPMKPIDRIDLKEKAKVAFKANYSASVVAALVLVAVTTAIVGSNVNVNINNADTDVSAAVAGAGAGLALVFSLLNVFVFNPLKVGGYYFFKKNNHEKAEVNELISAFKSNYANSMVTTLLTDVFTLLWTLLFIVPGIVKSYSYAMVPFLIADHPDLQPMEVIKKSQQMMDGYKWQAFVLDLSFLGWQILSILTLGILGIFYVNPYYYQTKAGLYEFLKDQEVVREFDETVKDLEEAVEESVNA